MSSYYLRVDAVNLDHFVYDTHDISTIRGGSYILLEAIKKLKDKFSGCMTPISTAASQGIFSFDCPADDVEYPEKLRQDILTFLHDETNGHATFVLAIEKGGQDFPTTLEKLEAQVHRLQWRLPTVAIPEFESTNQECYLDGWRPGVEEYRVDPDVAGAKISKISASTKYRRERGRDLKQKLFYELLGDEKYKDQLCVKDLSELARDGEQGILDGKIAFIQVDGNGFGRLRRKLCTTPKSREGFDAAIQEGFRKVFMKTLLHHADHDPKFKTKDASGHEALRIEVLIWGGDEMTLIVPAWKGLEVVELFFRRATALSFNGVPLSHRAAVVFCHHNMPVLQIRQVAESLLQQAKKDIRQDLKNRYSVDASYKRLDASEQEDLISLVYENHGNACHYLVLESFDILGGSLNRFIDSYYQGASYHHLLLRGDEIGEIVAAIKTLKAELAFGQVLKIIECLRANKTDLIEEQIGRMLELVPKNKKDQLAGAIRSLIGDRSDRWYILADLWNYATEGGSHE